MYSVKSSAQAIHAKNHLLFAGRQHASRLRCYVIFTTNIQGRPRSRATDAARRGCGRHKVLLRPQAARVGWDAKVRQAQENIDKADSMDSAVSELAALLDSLNDSHTAFILPLRNYVHRYGFSMKMIGDRCYVIRVHPGSDAEKKGLRRGDQVLAVNDLPVTRKTFWKIEYIFQFLRPQPRVSANSGRRKWPAAPTRRDGKNRAILGHQIQVASRP
jgi:hypothetical protein